MNANNICNPLFFLITSYCGIYVCIYFACKIEENNNKLSKLLEYIGKNTLIIMALHFLAFKVVKCFQFFCGNIQYEEIGILTGINCEKINIYIIYIFVGVTLPLIFDVFFKKIKKVSKKYICLMKKVNNY